MNGKRVMIVKCSSEEYWYKDLIGAIVYVDGERLVDNPINRAILVMIGYSGNPNNGYWLDECDILEMSDKEAEKHLENLLEVHDIEKAMNMFIESKIPVASGKSTYLVMTELELTDEEAALAEDEPTVRFIQKI